MALSSYETIVKKSKGDLKMKRIILILVTLAATIGFMSTASALTPEERAQIMCEGKLHACLQLTGPEMDAFLATAGVRACVIECSFIDTPACSEAQCNDRCFVAAGLIPTATSCL